MENATDSSGMDDHTIIDMNYTPSEKHSLLPPTDKGGPRSFRRKVYDLLEANNYAGMVLEALLVLLIILNVLCFMLSTENTLEDNDTASMIFDIVEICTVVLFTMEYILRFYSIAEATDANGKPLYAGLGGRLRWAVTDFYSWIDLASIVPFYIDILVANDLPATQFIRLARMLRMMKEGGFQEAFSAFGDILHKNKKLITTSAFVGFTTWLMLSSFNFIAERNNPDMIWTYPSCYSPNEEGDDDSTGRHPCMNRYGSILSASYFTLLNLFGEFPLMDAHTTAGRYIGIFTAVVAVAVFAIPTGIFGSGFEDMIRQRKERKQAQQEAIAGSEQEDFYEIEARRVFSGDHQHAAFSFLDGRTIQGKMYSGLLALLVTLDVIAFALSTLDYLQDGIVYGAGYTLSVLEIASVTVFTLDYAARAISASTSNGLMRYLWSFYGIVDLLSVLPFFVGLSSVGGLASLSPALLPTVVRALRLIRMLKLERYVRAFTVFDDVLRDSLDILAVSGFFALVVWVFASTLLYYTERYNPDPNMTPYYESVPMSMWITLLNLSGEAPLCDYTLWGKIITAILGVFGVGVFAVPVGLLGAGFEEWVETIQSKEAMMGGTQRTNYVRIQDDVDDSDDSESSGPAFRKRLHMFLEARTVWGRRFEAFIMVVIFITITEAIVMTMPSVCDNDTDCPTFLGWLELVAVIIFTMEYACRIYAAPEAYPELSPCVARLHYMVSFYAIVDFLAVFPYYFAQAFEWVDQYDNYLRLLRILRILKLDKYNPCVTLIDDVFRIKARGLLVAGFASAVMLAWFCTIMYLVERGDDAAQMGCFTEAERFSSVVKALQYDLILLTGDYPLIDFTLLGRFVNFVQIMVAVGVVAVPSGLIANGFSQVLEESRKEKHTRRRSAAVKLQRLIRGHLARRRLLLAVEEVQRREEERKRRKQLMQEEHEAQLPVVERARRMCYRFSTGLTPAGKAFDVFVGILIILNVAAVVAEAEPGVGGNYQTFFDMFEAFSVLVFTAEILMRLFIAPISSKYAFSRWNYITSFYGIIDLASILPWYVETILMLLGVYFQASVFRVLRLFRIFQVEHFVSAFTLLDDVWNTCKDTLAATGLLALILWIGSSCLFYIFEKGNVCTEGAFNSIPSAMYYVAVFLGGEWATVDFTWPGKILCCALCVMGIALFAIPVGTVFEAFQDVLQEVNDSAEDEQKKTSPTS